MRRARPRVLWALSQLQGRVPSSFVRGVCLAEGSETLLAYRLGEGYRSAAQLQEKKGPLFETG